MLIALLVFYANTLRDNDGNADVTSRNERMARTRSFDVPAKPHLWIFAKVAFGSLEMLLISCRRIVIILHTSSFTMGRHPDLVKFGERVRQLRQAEGVSQEKLAELAELHRTYIGGIERGERNVALLNILRIAKALNASPCDLLKDFE
jgi:DNA-binding XRE family transcriptional regulator